ncbi:hypothetical protein AB0K89_04865 [Streptomyces cinnamoneus]|uniref:hypothetical protein n=1 Tax=Streptomyces cinnamoneus TaxID=53446 RepID=UPI00344052D4
MRRAFAAAAIAAAALSASTVGMSSTAHAADLPQAPDLSGVSVGDPAKTVSAVQRVTGTTAGSAGELVGETAKSATGQGLPVGGPPAKALGPLSLPKGRSV